MSNIKNQYVLHAALPSDWTKADKRAIDRLHKTVEKLNAQIEDLSTRGVLVEIRRIARSNDLN